MHIGIDARLTYYRSGGISNYIQRLVAALELLDRTNRYTVFHSRKSRQRIVRRFAAAALWTPSHHRIERLALSAELARFRLNLYHATDFIPPYWGARRMVATVHDLTFLKHPEYLTADSRRYYNDQIHAAVHRADHLLTLSEASKHDIISMLNVPASKITVHLLGVDEQFCAQPAEVCAQVQRELDLPPEYLLFVSTFEPRKNILGLLEAYRLLLDRFPDAPPLVLAGRRGWLFEETLARFERMGIASHVYWREEVAQAALPALYTMALALILPSFYEGFGLPALEAMACGTVPIVSNRSSLPEVVGDVGLLVDPEDPSALASAIEQALTNSAWRQQMQKAAQQRAAQFTWQQTAETTLQVYLAEG